MVVARKDKNPIDTIKYIKKILKNNNIKTKEYKIKSIHKKFYSVRVEIKGLYNTGTNGKGETKELARASAYAELIERLASKNLINNYFLNKEIVEDNKLYKYIDLNNNQDKIIKSFYVNDKYNKNNINDSFKLHTLFKDIINNKNVFLPIKLVYFTSLSNGLCSGNTYYEVITQGICEIFERYCYKTILETKIILNNVVIDNNLPIYEKIKYLESLNYHIQIKDCTLGKYPVIGVLIFDSTKSNYIFTVGSDPNINIAIQRCLTEAFQGLKNDQELLKKMKPINNNFNKLSSKEKIMNWFMNYTCNNGIHPKEMLFKNKTIHYKDLKTFIDTSNNIDTYYYLVDIVKNNKLGLYIKDYSYLSFPVYKVFIPYLSNIFLIDKEEEYIMFNYEILKNIYYDIEKEYSGNELDIAISVLERIMITDRYSLMNTGNYFHSEKYIKTNYNKMSFELLFALLNYKKDNDSNPSKKIKNPNIKSYLENIEKKDISTKYLYILNDLKIINPSCPICNKCKCKKTCVYKKWKNINNVLKKETI